MIVDLRSDTVTRPTAEMREAMISAPLGDDVLGDEPTVTELEAEAAQLLGFEAAVFVPSGTMANQIALATHCERGDAALFDEDAHMLYYEVGAPGVIAQVITRGVPSEHGVMDPDAIRKRLLKYSLHTPPTTLLCVENTHNRAGGAVIPLEMLAAYRKIADEHGLRMHLDGARAFNAATQLNVNIKEITRFFDSVSICLSKGLAAPVGSILLGNATFIDTARRWRKRLGGGMRQSGILAACGLVSLRVMRHRLLEDHRRARMLAERINQVPGCSVDLDRQQTNFAMIQTQIRAEEWCEHLNRLGVLCMPFGPHTIRLVTHNDISDEAVDYAVGIFQQVSQAVGTGTGSR